jgi:hypothetical protein
MRGKLSVSAALIVLAAGCRGGCKVAVKPVWLPRRFTPRSDYSIVEQNVAVDRRTTWLRSGAGRAACRRATCPQAARWQAVQLAACGSARPLRTTRPERDGRLAQCTGTVRR